MSEWAQEWILEKLLRKIVREFSEEVYMEQLIEKQPLYKHLSWWFRFSRKDSRKALRMLAEAYEGIEFGNRGLKISREHLAMLRDGLTPEKPSEDGEREGSDP